MIYFWLKLKNKERYIYSFKDAGSCIKVQARAIYLSVKVFFSLSTNIANLGSICSNQKPAWKVLLISKVKSLFLGLPKNTN